MNRCLHLLEPGFWKSRSRRGLREKNRDGKKKKGGWGGARRETGVGWRRRGRSLVGGVGGSEE